MSQIRRWLLPGAILSLLLGVPLLAFVILGIQSYDRWSKNYAALLRLTEPCDIHIHGGFGSSRLLGAYDECSATLSRSEAERLVSMAHLRKSPLPTEVNGPPCRGSYEENYRASTEPFELLRRWDAGCGRGSILSWETPAGSPLLASRLAYLRVLWDPASGRATLLFREPYPS